MNLIPKSIIYLIIWKRYGRLVRSLGIYLLLIILMQVIHSEFLSYANISGHSGLVGVSFILKWLFIAIISLYIIYIYKKTPTKAGSKQNVIIEDDPFRKLRYPRKLISKGDVILREKAPRYFRGEL